MKNNSKNFVSVMIVMLLAFFTISIHGSNAVNNTTAGKRMIENQKSSGSQVAMAGSVRDDLEKAKKEGKAVFLIVTGLGTLDISGALETANQANKQVKKSVVLQMNRDDATNGDYVKKFGISGVQVPFILVVSAKGYAVGGFPAGQATAENLVKLVPSPKYDEVLTSLNNKKPVFVVVSKTSFTDKTGVLVNCKSAAGQVKSSPEIVEVSMDDANETDFLKQLGVSTVSKATVVVVINAAGNITGTFTGTTDAKVLTEAAQKVVKSCCAGGNSSGCKPKDCKK